MTDVPSRFDAWAPAREAPHAAPPRDSTPTEPVKRSGVPVMTFCEFVGVIVICVLPVCAMPTTGIVTRDKSAAQVKDNFLILDYPFPVLLRLFSKVSARFPDSAHSLLHPAYIVSFERGVRDGDRNASTSR